MANNKELSEQEVVRRRSMEALRERGIDPSLLQNMK